MKKEERSALATKVMNLLLAEGLEANLVRATPEQSLETFQNIMDVLTAVQGRLTATYLMKLLQRGDDPADVTETAQTIVDLVNDHLDQAVSMELFNMVNLVADLVDSQGKTSH